MRACFIIAILTLGACGDTPEGPSSTTGSTDTGSGTTSTTAPIDGVDRTTHMGQMMLIDRVVDGVPIWFLPEMIDYLPGGGRSIDC